MRNILSREETIDQVECPKCGAGKGDPCARDPRENNQRRDRPIANHQERTQAGRAQLRERSPVGRGN